MSKNVFVQITNPKVGENCDIFPFASIQEAEKNEAGEYWSKGSRINFPLLEISEKPKVKCCPDCGNEFPEHTPFLKSKDGQMVCVRSFERLNVINRDEYRAAVMNEMREELSKKSSVGVELIREERQRQVEKEGWSEEHDEKYVFDELAMAAVCYTIPENLRNMGNDPYIKPVVWPWDAKWWKPTPEDRERELVKAGALIVAEIERRRKLKGY